MFKNIKKLVTTYLFMKFKLILKKIFFYGIIKFETKKFSIN